MADLFKMTRRSALKRTFVFSAGLLSAGLAERLLGRQPVLAAGAGDLHVLAMADFGTDDLHQVAVARAMEHYAARLPSKLAAVLAVGDNFYGPMAPERFVRGFEEMYGRKQLDCPFHVCLGNHDYEEQKAVMELAYARDNPESRWKMPAKWYATTLPGAGGPLVRIICLDSNYDGPLTPGEEAEQVEFLDAELAKPTPAPWTMVAAHHPLFTNGPHKDNPKLIERWGPSLTRGRVPLYVCGHDHMMQHLEIAGYPTSFVVTGGGGYHLHKVEGHHGVFADSSFGFAHFQISQEALTTRLLNEDGDCLHAFARSVDGTMKVLSEA